MFFGLLLLRDTHVLSEPGVNSYTGFASRDATFSLENASLSAQFLFVTNRPGVIRAGGTTLKKPHFLVEGPSTVDLTFTVTVMFTVWVFPKSLCEGTSVFAANDSARFRLHYQRAAPQRCFFAINRQSETEFILFSRPAPYATEHPLVFAVNDQSVVNGSFWMSGTAEMPRTTTSDPLFYGFSKAVYDSEWALNINFTKIDASLRDTCFFEPTVIYDGSGFNTTVPADLNHFYQCGFDDGLKLWMYIMFGVWLVISLIIIFVVGYCCYRSWNQPEDVALASMAATSNDGSKFNNVNNLPLVSPSDALGDDIGYTEPSPFQ